MALSTEEIGKRLIRLRNLERLYAAAKKRIALLESENTELRRRIAELEDEDRNKGARIETMAFELEQIKIKLFGRKPPERPERMEGKKERKERDNLSYGRPIPPEITETRTHHLSSCPECAGPIRRKETRVFFEEDIPLPVRKTVIRHEAETGYCPACRKRVSGVRIPPKKVVLGNNVRKHISALSVASRLSHGQIQDHLRDVFGLKVSRGEIGNTLSDEAKSLQPQYQALKDSVLSQSAVHYDETSWKVQEEGQGSFAWVAAGVDNRDTVFSLGRSRGKGNIEDIGTARIGISDDYGAYRNAFDEHQLCFAHPHRKLRDMAVSAEFEGEEKARIKEAYARFSALYQGIRARLGTDFSPYLRRKWQAAFDEAAESHCLDPAPLQKIKTSLRKNKAKYFTFLRHPGLPVDNNKAERALRHLVIKRKISFGSKTQRGAETLSILASVILSLKWNDPEGWFGKYVALRG